jgi:ATP-dependent protease ClpP protease subunit
LKNRHHDGRFSARALELFALSALPQELSVKAAAADTGAEILLYDAIGWGGISAKDFVLALAQAGDGPITLRINSPGGDVFDGMAIYNSLRNRKAPVHVVVDGIAASAASFIAMAGTTLSMAEQSMMMIHNCQALAIGDRNTMLDMAAVMEKIDGQLASIYATKSGKSASDIAAMMDAEAWFTSNEAKAAGLCDIVTNPPKQTATNDLRVKIKNRVQAIMSGAQAALPSYDPDGDGDNDAEEALGMINAAMVLLGEAVDSLSGAQDADDAGAGADDTATAGNQPIVPGASAADDAALIASTEAALAAKDTKNARLRRLRLAEADAA